MITDILGGKAGATDAASSAKHAVAGRKDADGSPSGFADALSGYGRDAHSQQPDDVPEGEGEAVPEDPMTDAQPAKTKPIIDLRPESLRTRSGEAENSAERLKPEETRKSGERQLTAAEKKLRGALAAAKAVAKQLDELHEKNAASGKDMAPDGEDADLDLSMLSADDAKIADVLSLLNGAETKAAELNATMPKNAAGAQNKRGKDADGRSDEPGALPVNDLKRATLMSDSAADPLSMPSDPDTAVPGTRVFRFSNARGEGPSVDMTVDGGRGGRTAAVEFKSSSNGAAENVTVLDSRRFLGLAPNSNGANLTAVLSGDPEWAAAMHPSSALSNAAAQSSTGTVVNMLKLQMNPHELGSVTATLRLHGEELNVHLTVETRAAYRQLSDDSGGILDALRAQGFAVDQVTISIASTAGSDAAGSQQGQAGQTGQQNMAEGGRQGQAAGRGQEQAANRQADEQGARNANDAALDNAAAAVSGGARPDHLYL
ncbi:flagellar hook-length control protein FliK [Neorhizobium petrolearium]|uniref:flagellar hook-length control protein FliK n=1 Tax=Neorhizobium petrolearium TaxID=515361 RepID=UPI003F15FDDC